MSLLAVATGRRLAPMSALSLLVGFAACGAPTRPPPSSDAVPDAADASGNFHVIVPEAGPPGADANGFCGNLVLPALDDRPNLYFILDRSLSMAQSFGTQMKSVAMHAATVGLVRRIGARANIGAAVFPGPAPASGDTCAAGVPVFPTQPGDSQPYVDGGKDGPVTLAFASATFLDPGGSTPTAATVRALTPVLRALSGRTYVILATDGGPNCNLQAACDAVHCLANIEGVTECANGRNCCDAQDPSYGPGDCLDTEPTKAAIAALLQAGIRTYVIGLPSPGTSSYASVLDEMALAGGTARSSEPLYYAVNQVSELDQVLQSIAATVILSCQFTLSAEPPEPNKVNVYFDRDIVAQDDTNGWAWTSATDLELRGDACAKLKSGAVGQVQIVSGCPTYVPK